MLRTHTLTVLACLVATKQSDHRIYPLRLAGTQWGLTLQKARKQHVWQAALMESGWWKILLYFKKDFLRGTFCVLAYDSHSRI